MRGGEEGCINRLGFVLLFVFAFARVLFSVCIYEVGRKRNEPPLCTHHNQRFQVAITPQPQPTGLVEEITSECGYVGEGLYTALPIQLAIL